MTIEGTVGVIDMLFIIEFGSPFIVKPSYTKTESSLNVVWGWMALRIVRRSFYDLATKKSDWINADGTREIT